MPTEKNLRLVDRLLAGVDPDRIAPEGCRGVRWGISLRGVPTSLEQGAVGVAVRVDSGNGYPPGTILYRFADLEPLKMQYSELTIDDWIEVINDAKEVMDQGDDESPAPSMLIYGPKLAWHYPTPLAALENMWDAHVNFFRGPDDKPMTSGGNAENPRPFAGVLAALGEGVLGSVKLQELQDMLLITKDERTAAIIHPSDDRLDRDEATKLALIDLSIRTDSTDAAAFV
ncbi:hypothetical protein, partial [Chitinimonas sp.]|uniref:hypothetical protein n=1 Tax=Chitinimonas sp. TaxID=1934313 RepID=UPI0035B1FD26